MTGGKIERRKKSECKDTLDMVIGTTSVLLCHDYADRSYNRLVTIPLAPSLHITASSRTLQNPSNIPFSRYRTRSATTILVYCFTNFFVYSNFILHPFQLQLATFTFWSRLSPSLGLSLRYFMYGLFTSFPIMHWKYSK